MADFGLLNTTQTTEYTLPGDPVVQWDPVVVVATGPTGSQRLALERSFTWTFVPGLPWSRAQFNLFRTLRAADGTIYLRTKDEDGNAVVWKAKTDATAGGNDLRGIFFGVAARFWNATKV